MSAGKVFSLQSCNRLIGHYSFMPFKSALWLG